MASGDARLSERRTPGRRARPAPGGSGPRAVATAALAVLGVVLCLALGIELAYWDRITPGVRALGVDVGGMTVEAAAERLQARAAEALDRPLVLVAGQWERRTTARELGLRMDAREIARAAYAVGRASHPGARLLERLDALVRGRALDSLGEHDRGVAEAYLRRLASELDRAPKDASLTLGPDFRPRLSAAQPGLQFDVQAGAQAVSRALAQREERVTLPVREESPSVTDEALQPVLRELQAMLAGPLELSFQGRSWRLDLAEIAALLALEHQRGGPTRLRIDEAALRRRLGQIARELDQEPRDARFDWTRGGLTVLLESREGRKLDVDLAVQLTVEALKGGRRRVELPVRVTPPAVSSDDPSRLGIRELIERARTSFAGSIEEKKHNIRLAAERLNGVVVPPGGLFSFNKAVGPTTLEAGFKWGFGITTAGQQVRTVPSVAGGICQVATTLFQAVFWAGYPIEERHWHLYWIPAYTSRNIVGLDVTVDEESGLDFQFINPTPHYVLIQAWTEGDDLHFALFGQKPTWKVEVDPPVITNRVPPVEDMVFEAAPTLPWGRKLVVETAREGFDVVVVRRVISGEHVRTLRLKSSYRPSRNVTLVGTQGGPQDQVEALLASARQAQSAQNQPVRGEGQPALREPTPQPTEAPTAQPSPLPTALPTPQPSVAPTATRVPPSPTPATATSASPTRPAQATPMPSPSAPKPGAPTPKPAR